MIKWIYGNTLPLVVELKEIIKTQEGTTTEDYIPPVGSEIEVWAIGEYKKKRFDYTIDENVVQFTDDGTLNVGTYGIRITVLEPESRRLRSFKCDELQIVNCTEDLDLGEFVQEDAVYLDAMPFFWAKGDKGDPFTYDDFTPEQLAGLVGQGVPQGGEQGQILVKNSDADYDTIWLANATGVTSVNGKAGIVTLDAQDVQALPQDTPLFSGDYNDLANKPTIPIVPTNVSAFNNDAGYLTEHQDISGKEDMTTIVPVTTAMRTLTTEVGMYYRIDVPVETLTIVLPAMADNVTKVKAITIYLTGGTTPAVTIIPTDDKSVVFQDGYEIKSGVTYEVNCLYNGAVWVVGALTINTEG